MNTAPEEIPSIAVLMTCFNRREQTLRCLDLLFAQTELPRVRLEVFLVDDGSRDGTADAVRARFRSVHVIAGSGNLYWNGGMRVAFAEAMKRGFDLYLWLNDDTLLFPTALESMLAVHRQLCTQNIDAILTGSTCDAGNGQPELWWMPLGQWLEARTRTRADEHTRAPCVRHDERQLHLDSCKHRAWAR